MLIVLISLLTLALLVALVLGLHRYQLSVAQSNADKHDPLPPLDSTALDSTLPDFELDEDLDEATLLHTSLQTRAVSEAPQERNDSSAFASFTAGIQGQPNDTLHHQPVIDDEDSESIAHLTQLHTATESGQSMAARDAQNEGQTSSLSSGISSGISSSHSSYHETTEIEVAESGSKADQSAREDDDEVTLISSPEFNSTLEAPAEPPADQEAPDPAPPHTPLPGAPEHQLNELQADSNENILNPFAADAIAQEVERATERVTLPPSPPPSPAPAKIETREPTAAAGPDSSWENTKINLPGEQVETSPSLPNQGDAGQQRDRNTLSPDYAVASAAEPEPASSDADNWQEEVQELKKQDRLDDALKLCQEQLPLWSAYQQASLIHRARLKQLSQQDRDIQGELKNLYDLAAKASFLHDRVKGLPNLPLSQLKKVDLDEVESLEMSYEQIGYNELRLIKKTDIKLLLEKWGKPQAHIKPRELHAETWKSLIARRQTTLF